MQVTTGTVVNGKIVIEGSPLAEGGEAFTLSAAQEDELLAAMAEIDRGEFITLEALMDSLPRRS